MKFTRSRTTLAVLALITAGLFPATDALAAPMANVPTPVNPAALLQSAQHQFTAGNYSAAIARLRSVVSEDATNATAFYWLGRCYYEIRDVDQAISQAERSVALEPLNSIYQDWLGRAYAQKAQRDKSYFAAVVFYQQQNQLAEMGAFLDAAARLGEKDPRLTFYRAEEMIMLGTDLDRAADYIKSYLASTPDRSDWPSHAAARECLGRVYEMQGRRMQAAEQYRASLQLDPGRTTAQTRLERLEKDSP